MTLDDHIDAVSAIVVIDELRICTCSDDSIKNEWNVSGSVSELTFDGHLRYASDMGLLFD
jgi:hypothetical protein